MKGLTAKMPELEDYKPTLNGISVKQLPEIKKWKVGKEYELCVKAKMTALKDGEYGEKGLNASFEVQNISVEGEDLSREKSPEEVAAEKISSKIKKGRKY